jgi:predicted RNase H-like HicB family nuclease
MPQNKSNVTNIECASPPCSLHEVDPRYSGLPMPAHIALIEGEPGAYGVVFPDAPGCGATGDTIEQALTNARVALGEWLEHSRNQGLGVPEPRTVDELLKDAEVVEQMKETGAALYEV